MKRYLFIISMLGMMLLPFSACDGILEGIYDSPAASDSNEFGFIRTDPSTHSGTIYIDATDYRRWTFIDFHTQKVDSVNVTDSEQKEPEEWDIAVHRYDVKPMLEQYWKPVSQVFPLYGMRMRCPKEPMWRMFGLPLR